MPFPCILLSRYIVADNDGDHPETVFQVQAPSRDSLTWRRRKGSSEAQRWHSQPHMICHHKMSKMSKGDQMVGQRILRALESLSLARVVLMLSWSSRLTMVWHPSDTPSHLG